MKRLVVIIAVLFLGFALNADLATVSVSGTVSDNSGSVIENVQVDCSALGFTSETKTDSYGLYAIQVPQGRQATLTYSHPSAGSNVVKNVNFSTDQENFDITMSGW